jgi:alkanesulfonate monooxygenase SsuD/methylene tetrahydromethanopterin reductase-like flavin-dependent oxidoreductase (luciferase family)
LGLRFGVGDFSGQLPPGSPNTFPELYSELIDQARLMDELGLDSMWLSEHHFAEDGYWPSVLVVIAALLSNTRRLYVGTNRGLASFYNPIRLAEDAIALDLLSRGRFVLGLSHVYRPEEYSGFTVEQSTDAGRLEELIPILRGSFSNRPFSHSGKYHTIPELTVTPGPHTPGGPPVLIATDGGIEGAGLAGRLADGFLVDPTMPWNETEKQVQAFDSGHANARGSVTIFVYGAIHEDGAEQAWAEVADGFRYMRHNYDRWMHKELTRDLPPAHYRLLLGTPAEVCEQVIEYRRKFGDRVTVSLRCNYPGMSPSAVEHQLRLWAQVADLARSKTRPVGAA